MSQRNDRLSIHPGGLHGSPSHPVRPALGAGGDHRACGPTAGTETCRQVPEESGTIGLMNRTDATLLAALTLAPIAGSIYASETEMTLAPVTLPAPPKLPREWNGETVELPVVPARWSMYEGPEELRTNIQWLGDLSALTTRK